MKLLALTAVIEKDVDCAGLAVSHSQTTKTFPSARRKLFDVLSIAFDVASQF